MQLNIIDSIKPKPNPNLDVPQKPNPNPTPDPKQAWPEFRQTV